MAGPTNPHLDNPPPAPPAGWCRVAFVADVHIGNHGVMGGPRAAGINRRAAEGLAVLRAAYDTAAHLGSSAFVVAGDLFDVDDPEPQLLAEAADILSGPVPAVLVVGNHDQHSSASGDHALGPLAAVPGIRVVEHPTVVPVLPRGGAVAGPSRAAPGAYLACIPYLRAPAAEVIEKGLRAALNGMSGHPAPGQLAVVAHAGGMDAATPPWLRDAHDALPVTHLDAIMEGASDLVFPANAAPMVAILGNWHDHKTWAFHDDPAGVPRGYGLGPGGTDAPLPNVIVQCGALVPTGFDNPGAAPGMYGSLILWDVPPAPPPGYAVPPPPALYRFEVPGPRFVTLTVPRSAIPVGLRPDPLTGNPAGAADAVLSRVRAARDTHDGAPVAVPLYVTVRGPFTDPEAAEVRRVLASPALGTLGGSRVEVLPPTLTAGEGADLGPATPGPDAGEEAAVESAADLAAMLHGSEALRGGGVAAIAAQYTATMPLPPGVTRERVTATVLRLLG